MSPWRASDIHIVPGEQHAELWLRIDGVRVSVRSFGKGLLPALVRRIKIIGRMAITEHRVPQDGRARIADRSKVVDLRISVLPTADGESVVVRLLSSQDGVKGIDELGFSPADREAFTGLLQRSNGIILVTGPTGSGKSTTLYAALGELVKQNVNIITVEARMAGIEQVQINATAGLTFARALRQILRHDPDVIMVGEIRDAEAGKIAVASALTGHRLPAQPYHRRRDCASRDQAGAGRWHGTADQQRIGACPPARDLPGRSLSRAAPMAGS